MIPILFLIAGLVLIFATGLTTLGIILTIIGAVMLGVQILFFSAIFGTIVATRKRSRF